VHTQGPGMTTPAPDQGSAHLERYDELPALVRRAAALFVACAREARARGRFTVVLAGGSTPRSLHLLLSGPGVREQVHRTPVQFYWGDERWVPPDDAESNYRMARETLLDRLPALRPEQVHRIQTELAQPAQAADQYEQQMRSDFQLAMGQLPRFDLIFLGLGP